MRERSRRPYGLECAWGRRLASSTVLEVALIETYFELPHSIGVEFVTLGTDFVTEVGGTKITIRFPRSEMTRQWPHLVSPAFVNVFRDDGFSNVLENVDWGVESGTSGDDPASKTAWVSAVGLVAEVESGHEQDEADRLVDSMEERWPQICDWIEVMTRQIHSAPGKALILGPHHPIWVVEEGEVKRLYRQSPVSITVRRHAGPDAPVALSGAQFESALEHSMVGPPPDEWLLIRDARLARDGGSHRLAVIDAGTAAELALTKLLKDRLAHVPPLEVEALLAGHRMLHASAALLKKLGGTLPTDTQKGLVDPRNAAVHKAVTPSAEESYQALMIAVEIVDASNPLASYV